MRHAQQGAALSEAVQALDDILRRMQAHQARNNPCSVNYMWPTPSQEDDMVAVAAGYPNGYTAEVGPKGVLGTLQGSCGLVRIVEALPFRLEKPSAEVTISARVWAFQPPDAGRF